MKKTVPRLGEMVLALGVSAALVSCMPKYACILYSPPLHELKINESFGWKSRGRPVRATLLEIDEAGKRCLFRVEHSDTDTEHTCWVSVDDKIPFATENESGYRLESIDRKSVILRFALPSANGSAR